MTDLTHAYAVVLAGGYGERFWPASTAAKPKQLLSLLGDRTMLEMAVDRLEGLIPVERVLVLTSEDLVAPTQAATPGLPEGNVIGEPMRRDTAAAVALAAAVVKARDPEGVFCIVTADHVMGELDLFRSTLASGLELAAAEDVLITIGITPRHPATGYGYIRAVDTFGPSGDIEFRTVDRFVEKPDRPTAQGYVDSGEFWWNSGMFIWSVAAVQGAFAAHRPELSAFIDALVPSVDGPDFAAALSAGFEPLEKISIDYALMERADNIVMAVGTFAWDDVGSWPAVGDHLESDDAGNAIRGDVEALDATNNIVVSEGTGADGRVTALIGVTDLIVVHTDTATLIVPKERAEDVKKLVSKLREDPTRTDLV